MSVASRLRVTPIPVGLGEIKHSSSDSVALVAYGLGSCVGVSIWDRSARIAALAHIILPSAAALSRREDNPLKYADQAIPAMINDLLRLGGKKPNFIVRIAGGAQMLRASGSNEIFNIGLRNVEQVRLELARAGLRIANEDVLGHQGRTMSVYPGTGQVTVQSAGNIKEL